MKLLVFHVLVTLWSVFKISGIQKSLAIEERILKYLWRRICIEMKPFNGGDWDSWHLCFSWKFPSQFVLLALGVIWCHGDKNVSLVYSTSAEIELYGLQIVDMKIGVNVSRVLLYWVVSKLLLWLDKLFLWKCRSLLWCCACLGVMRRGLPSLAHPMLMFSQS